MSKKSKLTASGSTNQNTRSYNYSWSWMNIWWPLLLIIGTLIIAGFTKYVYTNEDIYRVMLDIIKGVGVIMVVMYVIYTRILAIETKRMAEASINIYNSEKGTVLAELSEGTCDFTNLPTEAQRITENLHINEKKLTNKEFKDICNEKNNTAILLKITNMSSRRIEASKIEYQVRHTGSDKRHEVTCDIGKVGTIRPWEDREIALFLAPEGEIELIIYTLDYLDASGVVQRINITKKIVIDRIRKPEKSTND